MDNIIKFIVYLLDVGFLSVVIAFILETIQRAWLASFDVPYWYFYFISLGVGLISYRPAYLE